MDKRDKNQEVHKVDSHTLTFFSMNVSFCVSRSHTRSLCSLPPVTMRELVRSSSFMTYMLPVPTFQVTASGGREVASDEDSEEEDDEEDGEEERKGAM